MQSINIYSEFFLSISAERNAEILFCIQQNVINNLVDKISLFVEEKYYEKAFSLFQDIRKINLVSVTVRPTIMVIINYINNNTLDSDINIISNSDIFFDKTLNTIQKLEKNYCFALSRKEIVVVNNQYIIGNLIEGYSQDAWLFKGQIRINYFPYYLGFKGVDNAFAFTIRESGYKIYNPSKSINVFHYHESKIRNSSKEVVPPPYLFLHNIYISELSKIDELNSFYESDIFFNVFLSKTNEKIILIDKIQEYLNQNYPKDNLTFVDIGAGYGTIIENICTLLEKSTFFFIEQSQYLYSIFKQKVECLKWTNVLLENNLAQNTNIPFFDFALLSHILFYVDNISDLLDKVLTKMKEKSVILIVNSNYKSLQSIKDTKKEQKISEEIRNYFYNKQDLSCKIEIVASKINVTDIYQKTKNGEHLLQFLLQKESISSVDLERFVLNNKYISYQNEQIFLSTSEEYFWITKQ
ncbi:hypothetical protein [Arundinibacter roseus]|uniref:Uncharacterized protein n=1 Tax=Arundinibacter roseus TaxID=2070510 RepID=A0A4R4KEL0_9BACT|nr:hypothetical protein [Arundinibacter roseus]TDB65302.1 hypothetical protein EZE20_11425 [Arundinibacter roseus]